MFQSLLRQSLLSRTSLKQRVALDLQPHCSSVSVACAVNVMSAREKVKESCIPKTKSKVREGRRQMASKATSPSISGADLTTADDNSNSNTPNLDRTVSKNLYSFCHFVKFDALTAEEQLIHTKHLKALQSLQEVYEDPATGYSVLTRLAHLRRGQCCGNACRHCPYGQKNVSANVPRKTYNSAFFV